MCAHMHSRSFILRKSQARMRNCILRQKVMDGRNEGRLVGRRECGRGVCGGVEGVEGWVAQWHCLCDRRERESDIVQSRIVFLKARTVNAAETWSSYSYTQECPAAC